MADYLTQLCEYIAGPIRRKKERKLTRRVVGAMVTSGVFWKVDPCDLEKLLTDLAPETHLPMGLPFEDLMKHPAYKRHVKQMKKMHYRHRY